MPCGNLLYNWVMIRLYFFFAIICFLVSCGSNNNPPTTSPPPGVTDYTWTQISPSGGFVSAVVYHPSTADLIWASGDDSSGIYKSVNGGAQWNLVTSVPLDHSSYSLVFDPTNSKILYAPNHFGRGLLKSTDAGANWTLHTTGLPTNDKEKRINELAIDPNDNQILYMALEGGLYKSTTGGTSFSILTDATFTANSDSDFRAIAISSSSEIYTGTKNGRVYKSTDNGASWAELTVTAYRAVSDIELTSNALYVAFNDGIITKSTTFAAATSFVNNIGGDIESGLWTRMKTVSGVDADNDILYIGTVFKAASIKWGFHVSVDGGTTLVKRVTGLDSSSAFALAVNPGNSNEIIMGTINNGLYKTIDQGLNWSQISTGMQALATLGFVENPGDSNHLLISSTAGLDGTSKLLETLDGGASWSEVGFFSDKSVRSLYIPETSVNTIIAGTFNHGIYKTTNGSSATWTQVSSLGSYVNRIRADQVNADKLYAVSYEASNPAHPDLGIYSSINGGDSWVKASAIATIDVIPHPKVEGEAVSLTADVFGTSNSFATFNSLGLSSFAPATGLGFFSGAFIPGNPSSLLIGASSGKLFRTDNYLASGVGVTWSEITVPIADVIITDIVTATATTWYLSCWIGDKEARSTSTPGILRTRDAGATWEFLSDGLTPSRLTFKLKKSVSIENLFLVGMWGAGFFTLSDP